MARTSSAPAFDEVEIVLPGSMYAEVQRHLTARTDREQIALLLAGTAVYGRDLRLLGREYVVPGEEDLDHAHYTGTGLTAKFNDAVLARAVKERAGAIIRVHTHPFSSTGVGFSGIDDHYDREEAKWLARHFPQLVFGSMVFGRESVDARVWCVCDDSVWPVPVRRIVAWDSPMRILRPESAPSLPKIEPLEFDRQIRAFGPEGQQRIGQMRVGIVGLGGIGSLVAEGLARLGVRRFVLVDPDKVDPTNRNRLLGLTAVDVENKRFKVNIAGREIRRVSAEAKIIYRNGDVTSASRAAPLKSCDMIVAATDTDYSRLFLQTLCVQYLIPLLNVGVALNARDGRVEDAYGLTQLWLPGRDNPCMLCAGLIDGRLVALELAPPIQRAELQARGYIRGADVPDPQVRPLNGIISYVALSLFHNFACGYAPPELAVGYDMLKHEVERYEYPKDGDCRICGMHGVMGRGDNVRMEYYRDRTALEAR